MNIFKFSLHAAMFVVDGACVCARVTLLVNDAYVFACEAADSSDLGRLLSCWKHTAAHQIFTAPSNSRLHAGSFVWPGGCWPRTVREERKTYQHRSLRRVPNIQEGQANHSGSFEPKCVDKIWPY